MRLKGPNCNLPAWLILSLLMCQLVLCELDKTCTLETRIRSNQGICGEKLAELLHFLCGGIYNKRSVPDDAPYEEPSFIVSKTNSRPSSSESTESQGVFLSRRQALAHLRRDEKRAARYIDPHGSGNGYQGIVCECCHHRCSFKELTQYCAHPRSAFNSYVNVMGKRSVYSEADEEFLSSPTAEKKHNSSESTILERLFSSAEGTLNIEDDASLEIELQAAEARASYTQAFLDLTKLFEQNEELVSQLQHLPGEQTNHNLKSNLPKERELKLNKLKQKLLADAVENNLV